MNWQSASLRNLPITALLSVIWRLHVLREALETGSDLRSWLLHRLKQFPYWTEGHFEFARLSLVDNDVAGAYAALQAVHALAPRWRHAAVQELLARCYLRRGAPEEAAKLLEVVLQVEPERVSAQEDLAACYVMQHEFDRARKLLEKIPVEQLSAESLAALEYVRSKISQLS